MCTTSIMEDSQRYTICNLNGLRVKPYFCQTSPPFSFCTAKIQNIFQMSKKRPLKSFTEEQIFFFLMYKANDMLYYWETTIPILRHIFPIYMTLISRFCNLEFTIVVPLKPILLKNQTFSYFLLLVCGILHIFAVSKSINKRYENIQVKIYRHITLNRV